VADTVNYDSYKESGHSTASGVAPLQDQASKIPTSDAALREQAVNQYADTYKTLDDSYSKQLSAIITSQANDEKLLTEQYNNSISSMMAQLQKRGLHVSTPLVGAQNAALNKHMNETKAVRTQLYSAQRSAPESNRATLRNDYEKAIAQRVAANRATYIPILSDVLASIAELQRASFTDYLDFILAKKSSSSGGGSSRKTTPTNNKNTYNPPKADLSGYDAVKDQNYVQAHQHFYYASGK